MQTIDVSDLPEAFVRAIQAMIQTLRQQLPHSGPKETGHDLPKWEGQILGKLNREEIYDNGV